MRRARGDDHALAGERTRRFRLRQQAFDGGDDLQRLRHAPDAVLRRARPSRLHSGRPAMTPSRGELRDVALRRRVAPHPRVHRRRQQDFLVGGEQHGGGEIVGMAAARASPSGRRWRAPRRSDPLRATRRICPTSNSLCGSNRSVKTLSPEIAPADKRRDEFLRRRGHHHAHRHAALAQAADQVERFIGGDAAADDQQDAAGGGIGRWPSALGHWPSCGARAGAGSAPLSVGRAAQDGADLVLDRAAVAGGAQPQRLLSGLHRAGGRSGWPWPSSV